MKKLNCLSKHFYLQLINFIDFKIKNMKFFIMTFGFCFLISVCNDDATRLAVKWHKKENRLVVIRIVCKKFVIAMRLTLKFWAGTKKFLQRASTYRPLKFNFKGKFHELENQIKSEYLKEMPPPRGFLFSAVSYFLGSILSLKAKIIFCLRGFSNQFLGRRSSLAVFPIFWHSVCVTFF